MAFKQGKDEDEWAKKYKELTSPASIDTLHSSLKPFGKGMGAYLKRKGGMSNKDIVTFIETEDKARKAQEKNQ